MSRKTSIFGLQFLVAFTLTIGWLPSALAESLTKCDEKLVQPNIIPFAREEVDSRTFDTLEIWVPSELQKTYYAIPLNKEGELIGQPISLAPDRLDNNHHVMTVFYESDETKPFSYFSSNNPTEGCPNFPESILVQVTK